MSSNVVFSETEQVQLQQLTAAQNQFETFKQLILRGQFDGQDASLVVEAVTFFAAMSKQTDDQLNNLRAAAASRSLNKPAKNESKKSVKSKKENN